MGTTCMKRSLLHKCFIWKCRDCTQDRGGCNAWLIRDRACGRWGEAHSWKEAVEAAINHNARKFWEGIGTTLKDIR